MTKHILYEVFYETKETFQILEPSSINFFPLFIYLIQPIPVAVPSKATVYGRSVAGTAGLYPAGCMDVCLLYALFVVS